MAINRSIACDFRYSTTLFWFLWLLNCPVLSSALSFDYRDFTNQPNLKFSGNASIEPGGVLSLTANLVTTPRNYSVGRAWYAERMHLWDQASGKAADFVTEFTFKISMYKPPDGADGLAFFLAPVNESHVPENAEGRCLGLISDCANQNATAGPIVAVEFDTFQNEDWDPDDHHVGININSIESVATFTWPTTIKNGSLGTAWIAYNSSATNLSLFLSYEEMPLFDGALSYNVDLSKVLPEWVVVGFSAATGLLYETHDILSWKFNSTDISTQTTGISNQPTEAPSRLPDIEEKGPNVGLLVGGSVGITLIVVGIGSICLCVYKKKARNDKECSQSDDSMDEEFEQGTGPKRFSYKELIQATNNFNEARKLGEGGFGEVYRGELQNPAVSVAVKRLSSSSKQGKKEYSHEVKIVGRLRHRNLVQLLGWCHGTRGFFLVYEFMPNRSLDYHLFRDENLILWPVRYSIACGLASALLYLHEESEQCVVHRDIKSSNVLLDLSFNTKLGDFGLARFMEDELGIDTTKIAGTPGYVAPEYASTGIATKASDVYSFGVVALEIACGKRAMRNSKDSLVSWVWDSYGIGQLLNVVDKRLNQDFDTKQMECLLTVGLWCANPDHKARPSIRQALRALHLEAPLPQLPPAMPVLKYEIPTASTSSTEPSMSGLAVSIGR